MVGLVAIELVLEDEDCGELGQILEKDVDKFSRPPHILLFDSWVRLVLNCLSTRTQVFSRRLTFGRRSSVGMVVGRDLVQSFWASHQSILFRFVVLLPCFSGSKFGLTLDSLPFRVPVACSMGRALF